MITPRSLFLAAVGAYAVVVMGCRDRPVIHLQNVATLPGREGPIGIVTGDFNGDGRQDIVISNFDSSTLSVFFGRPGGGFNEERTVEMGVGCNLIYSAAGRLDTDPRTTLVLSGPCGVRLLKWTGLSFDPVASYLKNLYCGEIVIADMNRDGMQDLVVADQGLLPGTSPPEQGKRGLDSAVIVLVAEANNGFTERIRVPVGRGAARLAVGDVNGDGMLDVVVGNGGDRDFGAPGLSVLLGDKNGELKDPVLVGKDIGDVGNVVCADMNGDGKDDVVVTASRPRRVVWFEWQGVDAFVERAHQAIWVGELHLLAATKAGRRVLVAASYEPSAISVLYGGSWHSLKAYSAVELEEPPEAVGIGDLNGDSYVDVICAAGGRVLVFQTDKED